jgi:hypothetical protein
MMTTDAIYLLGEDGRLEKVPYTRYATEDVLQELIASYPELIVGEQIDPDDPPRPCGLPMLSNTRLCSTDTIRARGFDDLREPIEETGEAATDLPG